MFSEMDCHLIISNQRTFGLYHINVTAFFFAVVPLLWLNHHYNWAIYFLFFCSWLHLYPVLSVRPLNLSILLIQLLMCS